MPRIVLKAIHENNLYAPGDWSSTAWTIRDDMTAIINVRYFMNDSKDADLTVKIAEDKYNQIFEFLDEAKTEDKKIFALDGSGWEFDQYDISGKKVYHRDHAFIYGIAGFEKLERLLNSLLKRH